MSISLGLGTTLDIRHQFFFLSWPSTRIYSKNQTYQYFHSLHYDYLKLMQCKSNYFEILLLDVLFLKISTLLTNGATRYNYGTIKASLSKINRQWHMIFEFRNINEHFINSHASKASSISTQLMMMILKQRNNCFANKH